jgi:uncharacterized protein (DUF1330 family)
VLIAAVIDVAPAGIEPFRTYEELVLALLERHGGRLERRLRSDDGGTEIHLIEFADRAGYEAYLADPERAAAQPLLEGVELTQRAFLADDVT